MTRSITLRRTFRGLSAIAAFVLTLYSPPAALAQDGAFSTISFGANVAKDVSNSDFQRIWSSRLAVDTYAEMPFYVGNVRLAARYLQAISPTLTDIRTLHMRAAWGPRFELTDRLDVSSSVSVGSLYMSFEDEPVDYRRSESELAFGASVAMGLQITSRISWELSTEWAHAFTSRPLDFVFVSSGLRYQIRSPEWLRTFLN